MEHFFEFVDVHPVQSITLRGHQRKVVGELQAVDYTVEGLKFSQNVAFSQPTDEHFTSDTSREYYGGRCRYLRDFFLMELIACDFNNFSCFWSDYPDFVFAGSNDLLAIV